MGSGKTQGPNHSRRLGPGLLLILAYPAIKLLAFMLGSRFPAAGHRQGGRRPAAHAVRPALVVYQDYQVGDHFMAMPALLLLSRHLL